MGLADISIDIKPDNIMIQLPNESIIKDAVTPWKPFRVENKEPNFLYWPNDNCDLMRRQHGIDYTMMLDIEPERQTSFGMGEFYLHDDVAEDDILSLNVTPSNPPSIFFADIIIGFSLRLGSRQLGG